MAVKLRKLTKKLAKRDEKLQTQEQEKATLLGQKTKLETALKTFENEKQVEEVSKHRGQRRAGQMT